ncbi:isochorismatase family protein [Nonomuraea sp. NPDC050536]|uniref:isochorismatase family protein n=1 Tax=Nonomuraea sp. NPDC050536 TaxID=3364366 RepID=UPI0037C5D66C
MGIPTHVSYPLPPKAPLSETSWRLDPSRAALLVHDLQEHFMRPFDVDDSPRAPLTANVLSLRAMCEARGVPVVYSRQPHSQTPAQRGLLYDLWGPGITNESGAALIDALDPVPPGQQMTKWRYSAFVRTDLAERLAQEGRDQLIIVGVYAHIGIQATAADAFMRDIEPFVVVDGCADFSLGHHVQAMTYIAQRCGRVLTTQQAISQLSGRSAPAPSSASVPA